MGVIIEFEKLQNNQENMCMRLMVYLRNINQPISVSDEISKELLACKPSRRSMKLEQIFNNVIDRYPDDVIIKDIDVMFNPEYQVDVLRILSEAHKRKRYSVIWPGRREEGKLVYGEEGFADYKVYEIEKYDITCVI